MSDTSRPFYVIAHNTNTIMEVRAAMKKGANAIEPDVNVFSDHPDKLCISHMEGDENAPSLQQFLTDLHTICLENEKLCLIIFDCKSSAATAAFGKKLLDAIRVYLTFDTNVHVIISVSEMADAPIFENICNILGPREALMIDERSEPKVISDYFKDKGVVNACYGNGISIPPILLTAPSVIPSMERACALRAASGTPVFVCVWTVNEEKLQEECIRIGVDAIICDDIAEVLEKIGKPALSKMVRLATLKDNPFSSFTPAYSLTVYTGQRLMAGTNADITFTLAGSGGSSQVKINGAFRSRMERGSKNYITLQSGDLGKLISVTVQRDDSGLAADWFLDKIVVESSSYKSSGTVVFKTDIISTEPVTKPFK